MNVPVVVRGMDDLVGLDRMDTSQLSVWSTPGYLAVGCFACDDELIRLCTCMAAPLGPESKLIHEVLFGLGQFPACAIFDCEDVPTCALNSRAGNCFGDSTVSVQAATVVSTFGPACFIMQAVRRGAGRGARKAVSGWRCLRGKDSHG